MFIWCLHATVLNYAVPSTKVLCTATGDGFWIPLGGSLCHCIPQRLLSGIFTAWLFYCRLATVQSGRLPAAPLVSTKRDVSNDDRCALLSNIRQLVPDHATRLRAVQVDFSYVLSNEVTAVVM